MTELELYIPGLLAVPARLRRTLTLPETPSLANWCMRASAEPIPAGRHGPLAAKLAMQHAPVAALAWLGATGERPGRQVLLATPVHFEAGMNDLVLFGGGGLAITAEERRTLADDLQAFFGDAPEVRMRGQNVFLLPPEPLSVRTTPLHLAQGQGVRGMLAEGDGARQLNAWLNELQMFLHGHAINREREAERKPSLNGLWPWGEGELPGGVPGGATVHAESDALRGLGRMLGEVRDDVALDEILAGEGAQLAEFGACVHALDADDIDGWQRAVEEIDRDVLAPVLAWLEGRRDAEAVLYAGDGTARRLRGREGWLKKMKRRVRGDGAPQLVEER